MVKNLKNALKVNYMRARVLVVCEIEFVFYLNDYKTREEIKNHFVI